MRIVLSLVMVMFLLVSCGPSERGAEPVTDTIEADVAHYMEMSSSQLTAAVKDLQHRVTVKQLKVLETEKLLMQTIKAHAEAKADDKPDALVHKLNAEARLEKGRTEYAALQRQLFAAETAYKRKVRE